LSGWIAAAVAILVVVAVVVVVINSGDSSEDGSATLATATPDARLGGGTPAVSLSVVADDDGSGGENARFEPNTLSGPAGQVIEIVMTNNGDVSHNLRVSGVDRTYDTDDDFALLGAGPGEKDSLPVKIDQPGSYPFRCDFHPQQTGVLVLR
jgi:plastocyanin